MSRSTLVRAGSAKRSVTGPWLGVGWMRSANATAGAGLGSTPIVIADPRKLTVPEASFTTIPPRPLGNMAMAPGAPQGGPQGGMGRAALQGGGEGAALGAIGGSFGGHAGRGAEMGAAMGGLFNLLRRREQMQAEQQQQQQEQQAHAMASASYSRALESCLTARGYNVR